jgi:hypothetical protein
MKLKTITDSLLAVRWLVCLGVVMSTVACANQPASTLPEPIASTIYTVIDADGFPQPARRAFQPGPDGTPLPPKNPEAATYWPPEFKQFLNSAVALFKRGGKEPTIRELETVLKVRLTPQANSTDGTSQKYDVSNIPFGPPEPMKWGHELVVLGKSLEPDTSWQMRVFLDQNRFCVNPYDLAIYFGETFIGADRRLHILNLDGWPPAYSWGLFKRGSQGEHIAPSIWITTPMQIFNQPHRDPGCITGIRLFGKFTKK